MLQIREPPIHGKTGGAGTKGTVAKLSIGVIVLLICTFSLLFSANIRRDPEPTRSSKVVMLVHSLAWILISDLLAEDISSSCVDLSLLVFE